jgi:hypothetical protein
MPGARPCCSVRSSPARSRPVTFRNLSHLDAGSASVRLGGSACMPWSPEVAGRIRDHGGQADQCVDRDLARLLRYRTHGMRTVIWAT